LSYTSSLLPAINKLGGFPATCVINLPWFAQLSVLHLPPEWFTARSETRYWLRIAIYATPLAFDTPVKRGGGARRNIVMPFGTEKLEWFGYPAVKKIVKICLFVLTEFTNATEGHTDTDRHRMTA